MSMGEYLVFVLFIIVNVGLVFENVSYILDIIDVICCFLILLMLLMFCLFLDLMYEDLFCYLFY